MLEYLAGFFDGEGSIYLRRRPRRKSPTYDLRMHAYGADLRPLYLLQKKFGGYVYRHRGPTETHQTAYVWEASLMQSPEVLSQLAPHLIVKKAQALLALRFLRECYPWGRKRGGVVHRVDAALEARREWYRLALQRQKKRHGTNLLRPSLSEERDRRGLLA